MLKLTAELKQIINQINIIPIEINNLIKVIKPDYQEINSNINNLNNNLINKTTRKIKRLFLK